MRRRLIVAFVGVATAAIVLFGVPRGIVVAQLVESERQALLDKSAEVSAVLAADASEEGRPVTAGTFQGVLDDGEVLELRADGGPAVVVPDGAQPPSREDPSAERSVPGVGTISVTYPRGSLREDIVRRIAPIALLALLLVALSGVAGWLLARRLSRPFTELAEVAESFGRGRLDAELPTYGIGEADAIARALEDSARRLRRMTRREREVIDYASHDLRTPITALRLTLEDVALWPDTPPEVARELSRIVAEVDRFSDAVATLVDGSSSEESVELVDVAGVLREVVRDRGPENAAGIRVVPGPPVLARLQPGLVRRAIELLVEHTGTAGTGPDATASVLDGAGYVTVVVRGAAEQSPGTRGDVWDQAVGVVGELGGRLTGETSEGRSSTWTLTLPDRALGSDT